jgi:hypothetical protein
MADISGLTTADSLSCSTSAGTGISGGAGNFCAVTQMGTVICWSSSAPAAVSGLGQATKAIWSGSNFNNYFAVQGDGSVWELGDNSFGQLGDGSFTSATVHTNPRLIHYASPVSHVVAMAVNNLDFFGYQTMCLLRADGSVICAGQSQGGASGGSTLGDGQQYPQAPRAIFVPVVGIIPVASEDGQCYDGVDNDGDGKTDLDDSDCAQDLGSATGPSVATVSFAGLFGNYLQESCNTKADITNYGGPEG